MVRLTSLASRLIGVMFLLLACLSAGPSRAGAAHKVALLIGNDRYIVGGALTNPVADVRLVAESLKQVGFETVQVSTDLGKADMSRSLSTFAALANGADVAVIYYAGHGMEVGGRNYLIPVDAKLANDGAMGAEAVPLDSVLRATDGAKLKLIVLDACRDNPFVEAREDQGRAGPPGLATIEPTGETLVVYSTKAGHTAADGNGRNSPFAVSLAQRLIEPGVDVRLMLGRVRDDVMASTGNEQEPFPYGSLSGREQYLAGAAKGERASERVNADPRQIEALVWQGSLKADNRIAYDDYLARYPAGLFAGQARANLARLNAAAPSGPARLPVPMRFVGSPAEVYRRQILPGCDRFKDRYPFARGATDEVSLTEMVQLFASDGLFDRYTKSLGPLIDRTGPVWRWRVGYRGPLPPEVPFSLDYAGRMRAVVDGGIRFRVSIDKMPADAQAVVLTVGGVSLRFVRGETEGKPVMWLLSGVPVASLEIVGGQGANRIEEAGTWSLFRLLDRLGMQNAGDNILVQAGGPGREVVLRLGISTFDNPFSTGEGRSFRCFPLA